MLIGGNKYKLKAPSLALCDRIGMEDIYQRVFGTCTITDNKVPLWIVYGYIDQTKNIEINQAKVVESITKEKTCRDDVKNGRIISIKKEKIDYATDTGGSMNHTKDLIQSSL